MIHFRRARDASLVFEVADGALANISVKGARLALKDSLVVGVADDVVMRLDAFVGGVAVEVRMA